MSPLRREPPPPRPLRLSYVTQLPRLSAEVLKRFARMWVGREASRLNKEACIQVICQGLTDPAAVQRVIADLSDFERAGLGLLKRYGQSAPTEVLATELSMLGLPFEDHRANYASWSARGGAAYREVNSRLQRGTNSQ